MDQITSVYLFSAETEKAQARFAHTGELGGFGWVMLWAANQIFSCWKAQSEFVSLLLPFAHGRSSASRLGASQCRISFDQRVLSLSAVQFGGPESGKVDAPIFKTFERGRIPATEIKEPLLLTFLGDCRKVKRLPVREPTVVF